MPTPARALSLGDTYTPPVRVCVIVACPVPPGGTPEDTASAIAYAVRKTAPGANVIYNAPDNPTKEP